VYDKLIRLTSISSVASGPSAPSLPVSFSYQYNSANQRTRMLLADGSWWEYRYDALGQVISGKRYWADGTAVAGQQFEYSFDDIGNRKSTAVGGDKDGAGLRAATYSANRLNQYSSRSVPGYVDILGIANPNAGVTVNGNSAYRKGEYFHYALNVPNSTAQYPTVKVVSQYGGGQTETGKVFVPPSTEAFTHDADGNLTSDGRWTYSWDGENRLVQMIRDSDSPTGARQKLVFEYDHQGRRIRKQFYTYNNGWQEQTDTIFLYDGWNLLAELNANGSNTRVRTYVWGTDLSGSMQGAGGVGGLLKLTYYGASTTNAFVAYDGNGNVMALIDPANGNVCARYEYGPFAEPIRSSGPLSKLHPIRFSTKYTDTEPGFLYYGYRYYNPGTGRWLRRDPVLDVVFDTSRQLHVDRVDHYNFVENSPVDKADTLGLFSHSHRCDSQRLAAIRAAEQVAIAGSRSAQLVLARQFSSDIVMLRNDTFRQRLLNEPDFAGTYHAWYITTSLTLFRLNHGFQRNTYGVECECECWFHGDALAYVNAGYVEWGVDDDIHFCPAFFRATASKQAETFLHEASHILAFTDDLMLNNRPPWPDNGRDAYWVEDLAVQPAYSVFKNFVNAYTRYFGRR